MIEVFKRIPEYPDYFASNLGNITSTKYGKYKEKKFKKTRYKGYYRTNFCVNGIQKSVSIHRLVAQTFLENPLNKAEVNHINGDKTDNMVSNLEWCTREENMNHAVNSGLISIKNCGMAKITEAQAEMVAEMLKEKMPKEVSNTLGVSINIVQSIRNKSNWKNITKNKKFLPKVKKVSYEEIDSILDMLEYTDKKECEIAKIFGYENSTINKIKIRYNSKRHSDKMKTKTVI